MNHMDKKTRPADCLIWLQNADAAFECGSFGAIARDETQNTVEDQGEKTAEKHCPVQRFLHSAYSKEHKYILFD